MKKKKRTQPTCGFIFGASGAGKGFCIGSVLEEFHGVRTFVTGDWCREHAKELADRGQLVSDDLINSVVQTDFLQQRNCFYLVDAPRSREQVYFFMEMFKRRYPGCNLVTIHMFTTYEQSVRLIKHRAERQRRFDDAKPEAVKKRLSNYFAPGGIFDTVLPILEERTNYHRVLHHDFDSPDSAEDNHIDAVLERTRIPIRATLGPQIFGHTDSKRVKPASKK